MSTPLPADALSLYKHERGVELLKMLRIDAADSR